jgi:hypothetical protein
MQEHEIYSSEEVRRRLNFEDRTFLVVVALLVLLGVSSLVLSLFSLSSSSAGSLPSQNAPPDIQLRPESSVMASQFHSFTGAIPVLSYVGNNALGEGEMLSPKAFAEQMQILDEAGFTTVSVEQVRRLAMRENVKLPLKPVLITFDGVSPQVWTDVDPILAKHKYDAAIFVLEDDLAESAPGAPTNYELTKALKASGRWEFGAHLPADLMQETGGDLATWEAQVREGLAGAIAAIETQLGGPVISLSYPITDAALSVAQTDIRSHLPELVGEQFDLGFLNTTQSVVVTVEIDKTMAPRLGQERFGSSPEALLGVMSEALPQQIPGALDTLTWIANGEGTCFFSERTLVISADQTTTCRLQSAVQEEWENVVLSGIVNGVSPTASVAIHLREQDSSFVEISVTHAEIAVQRVADGVVMTSERIPVASGDTIGPHALLVQLRGTRVEITLDGRELLSTDVGVNTGPGRVSLSAVVTEANSINVTHVSVASTIGV